MPAANKPALRARLVCKAPASAAMIYCTHSAGFNDHPWALKGDLTATVREICARQHEYRRRQRKPAIPGVIAIGRDNAIRNQCQSETAQAAT